MICRSHTTSPDSSTPRGDFFITRFSGVASAGVLGISPAYAEFYNHKNSYIFIYKGELIMSTSVFIKRHPLLIYYALTFTISWGGILIIVGPDGIPGTTEEFQRMFLIVSLALLAGPSVSGLLLTGLVQRRVGFRELFSRLFRWSVAPRWYAVAFLTAPVLMTVIPLGLSLFYSGFLPGIITKSEKPSLLLIGIIAGLMAGISAGQDSSYPD
jgi:hypothetical protein